MWQVHDREALIKFFRALNKERNFNDLNIVPKFDAPTKVKILDVCA